MKKNICINIFVCIVTFTALIVLACSVEAYVQSVESVTTYKEQIENGNEALASENINDIITTITYSSPATFDEVAYFAQNYDIRIVQIQARGIAPDGTRITIFSRTDKGFEETEDLLLEQAQADGYELIGVIGIHAMVNSNMLIALQSDSLTYLADTTGDGFFIGATDSSSIERNNLNEVNVGKLFPQSLYWDLEELGIIDATAYSKY